METIFYACVIFAAIATVFTIFSALEHLLDKITCEACSGIKRPNSQYCRYCTIDMRIFL